MDGHTMVAGLVRTRVTGNATENDLEEMLTGSRGRVLLHGDSNFDIECFGLSDERPEIIVEPMDATDVETALRFARRGGFPVAIRNNGFVTAPLGKLRGGILLDLGRMTSSEINHHLIAGIMYLMNN